MPRQNRVTPSGELFLPAVDQRRVDAEVAGQLIDGLVTLEGGQGDLGLERRCVNLPLRRYRSPKAARPPKPKKLKKGINLENDERTTDGMARDDVEAMLGKGTEISSSGVIQNIGDRSSNVLTGSQKIVSIVYENGVVIEKSKLGF